MKIASKIENPTLNLTSKDISCYGNNDGQINIYSIDFSTDIYTLISPISINSLVAQGRIIFNTK